MSKEKARGTAWESDIVTYLRNWWPAVKRQPLQGKHDEGDIDLFPWACLEAKNQQRMALSEWLDEATREGKNRNSWLNVTWHKRARKASPGHAYVTMDGETFVAVLRLVEEYYKLVDASEAVVKELTK